MVAAVVVKRHLNFTLTLTLVLTSNPNLSLVNEHKTHCGSMFGEKKDYICLIIKGTSCKLSFFFPKENTFQMFSVFLCKTLKDILGMVRCHLAIFIYQFNNIFKLIYFIKFSKKQCFILIA